jgi:Domain of unknown function (DUF4440)
MARLRTPFYWGARVILSILLMGLAFITKADTTAQRPPAGTLPLTTRLVAEFYEKETALARALTKGDRMAAQALVDPDFELVAAADLGQSISFDAMANESAKTPHSLLIREMFVRDLGSLALVSFYWDENDRLARKSVTWMVVDAWKPGPDGWKLKTRFISARRNSGINPPGYRPEGKTIEKRY